MFVESGIRGEKVSPFPQTSPWLALWLGEGAAELKDAGCRGARMAQPLAR